MREPVASRPTAERSLHTSNNLLALHLAAGRLLRVRRGLYAVVPRGVDSEQMPVDPYLIASQVTEDGVVAYHAALQFHGKAYSDSRRHHYLTPRRGRPFHFRELEFIPVAVPSLTRAQSVAGVGILEVAHAGGRVRVTTLQRTLVDVLDAPDKRGGWEELWRSLEMIESFDLDAMIRFVLARA